MQNTDVPQNFLDRELAALKIVPAPIDIASVRQDAKEEHTLLGILRYLATENILQTYQDVVFIPWPDDDPLEIELRQKNAKKV